MVFICKTQIGVGALPYTSEGGKTDLTSGRGRQQMMLMRGSLQVSQNGGCGCQRKVAPDVHFRGIILAAGGCGGC